MGSEVQSVLREREREGGDPGGTDGERRHTFLGSQVLLEKETVECWAWGRCQPGDPKMVCGWLAMLRVFRSTLSPLSDKQVMPAAYPML